MCVGTPTPQRVLLKCALERRLGWDFGSKSLLDWVGGNFCLQLSALTTICNTMTGIGLHVFPYSYVDVDFIALFENIIPADYIEDRIIL